MTNIKETTIMDFVQKWMRYAKNIYTHQYSDENVHVRGFGWFRSEYCKKHKINESEFRFATNEYFTNYYHGSTLPNGLFIIDGEHGVYGEQIKDGIIVVWWRGKVIPGKEFKTKEGARAWFGCVWRHGAIDWKDAKEQADIWDDISKNTEKA